MKTICFIPVRLSSKRIPKKNIRLMNGKPLVAYAIEAAKLSHVFDEIYVNSESEIIREIAEQYGVKFYKRSPELCSDTTTNDEFAADFMRNVECDNCFQLLCTSPFIAADDIVKFYDDFTENKYETLIAVKSIQIECLYKGLELNFHRNEHTKPSQSLNPVHAYVCSLMMWNRKKFLETFDKNLGAYHGNTSKVGYHELKGLNTLDIDNEEDFSLAEQIMKARSSEIDSPEYYRAKSNTAAMLEQSDVATVLRGDGVKNFDDSKVNLPLANINEICKGQPMNESWSYRLVLAPNVCATLICQMQHERNRKHFHEAIGEFWIVIRGQYRFDIGENRVIANEGDIVYCPPNTVHHIIALSEGQNIRLAVSKDSVQHLYTEE